MTAGMFATTTFLSALHSDRQTDGPKKKKQLCTLWQPGCVGKCFCSNYSLVLGRREKKKKDQLKWNLRRSPQLPGLSDCCGCKFPSNSLLFTFCLPSVKRIGVDMSDTRLQVQSTKHTGLSGRQTEWFLSQWQNSHMEEKPEREGRVGEWWEHRWKWHCKVVCWTKSPMWCKNVALNLYFIETTI